MFNFVRLLNTIEFNQMIMFDYVQLCSIEILFDFVRLDTPGIKESAKYLVSIASTFIVI